MSANLRSKRLAQAAGIGPRVGMQLERLEDRSLYSAYVFHEALEAMGVAPIVAENSPPFAPPGEGFMRYGHSATTLGDLDGDQHDDYAISAPGAAEGPLDGPVAGAVFVRSGRTGDILMTLSDGAYDFGLSLANVGDVDGDGRADLAVGSPHFDANVNAAFDPAGRVWIYSSASGSVLRFIDGQQAFDEFGAAIATTMDMNGDAKADLLIGAPGAGSNDAGAAYVHSVATPGLLRTFGGIQPGERFGAAVATTRTHENLLAIGAPGHGNYTGRVVLLDGANVRSEWFGARVGDHLGTAVALLFNEYGVNGASHTVIIGIPGADEVLTGGAFQNVHGGVATDRGAVMVIEANGSASGVIIGGQKIAGAHFGSRLANVGDLDGDRAEDLGVAAPGIGWSGEASFFRGGTTVYPWATDPDVSWNIGLTPIAGLTGRTIAPVGDVNNDGFPDVMVSDGAENAQVVAGYAVIGPIRIDGVSPNLRYAWSQTSRPFVVQDGVLRAFSKIDGLIPGNPRDFASIHSLINGIDNSGRIYFQNRNPVAGIVLSPVMVLDQGELTLLSEHVDVIESGGAPNFDSLAVTGISSAGHLLLTGGGDGGRVWVMHEGILASTPFHFATNVNAQGTVLGARVVGVETEWGTWSRAAGEVLIQGLDRAGWINDLGVVAGVLAGTQIGLNPGNLAIWNNGAITDLGPSPDQYILFGSAEWNIRSFDSSGRILADLSTGVVIVDGRFNQTYLYEPDRGLRKLEDATHALGSIGNLFGSWAIFSPQRPGAFHLAADGRIVAYSGVLEQVDDEAPYILRSDSPTASVSTGGVAYAAGVSQYGELLLFREGAEGWDRVRLMTRLVSPGASNLVMFVNPADGNAYVALGDQGLLLVFGAENAGEPGVGGVDVRGFERPAGQSTIVDNLTTFTNTTGVVHLAGLDANGDLVIYFLSDAGRTLESSSWTFDNLSQTHLAARGLETPQFASNLTAFVTAWGTMHIAGLDHEGHVQVIWWAPDSPLWRMDDLSATALDTRAMRTKISAFVTPWDTLHINGIDEQGRVVALWWAPGFDGEWRVDQLAPDGSTELVPETMTSYVTPWGGLNVIGRDAVSGRAASYWWAPASGVWSVEILRTEGNVVGPRLAGSVSAHASPAGTLNLFARGLDGHLTRLYWNPGDGGIWTVEDLSVIG